MKFSFEIADAQARGVGTHLAAGTASLGAQQRDDFAAGGVGEGFELQIDQFFRFNVDRPSI